jgi:hypothetical protein
MERTLRGDFHIAKLALFNARLMNELGRSTEPSVQDLLRNEWRTNGLSGDLVPVNQSTFMQMSYVCLVWLWESIKQEGKQSDVLNGVFDKRRIPLPHVVLGSGAKEWTGEVYLRRLRNALSHGHVEVNNHCYRFIDRNPKKQNDSCEFQLTWEELGTLTEAVLFTVSDLLYPKSE